MMNPRPSTSAFIALRAGLGLVLLALVGTAWVTSDSPAQNPDPKGTKADKPDDDKPAKTRQRVEEEEEDAKPKRKVIRVEEEEKPKTAPAHREASPVTDLAKAARQAKHEAVKKLFLDLAVPHDVVTFKAFPGVESKNRETMQSIEPLPQFVGNNPKALPEQFSLKPYDDEWRHLKPLTPGIGTIKSIQPYEWVARDAVREFLNEKFESFAPVDKKYLSHYDKYFYAREALAAVLRFHESSRLSGPRRGDEWDEVEAGLRLQLLTVSVELLQELTKVKDWDAAFDLARRLAETYPGPEEQQRIALPLAKLLRDTLDSADFTGEKFRDVRERRRQLTQLFPGNEVIKQINAILRQKAEERLAKAQELVAQNKDPAGVQALLKEAEDICPDMPELRTYQIKQGQKYPILRVGVRELPQYLSPGLACTDVEVRAVELLFESLMKASPDGSGAVRYRPGLAEGRTLTVALGREFQLPANAAWSNDKPITVADFRHTLRLWKEGRGTGRSPAWADLFAERDEVMSKGDPPRVTIHLRQGCPDPFALMTFKIVPQRSVLPEELRRTDANEAEKAFALDPIGSGPYRLDGKKSDEQGRPCRIFLANSRPSKLVQPSIHEVRFYTMNDPVKAFDLGSLDMALDLTPEQAASLKGQAKVKVYPPIAPNRRVFFLAVNHRNPTLQNPAVRRALAYAINREELLDAHFRKTLGNDYHKALNSPYPAKSWVLNPTQMKPDNKGLDPFDAALARGLLGEAKDVRRPIELSLKYPSGDDNLADAMKALAEQVERNTDGAIKLQVQPPVDPHTLREEVEGTHSYELAYYHYDYPDETFWLGPLLGPRALPNGGNYLGYQGELSSRAQNALSHRHFDELQKEAREIHKKLNTEMPLIPLWQLDPLIALHAHVKPAPFDPWLVFTDIEQWQLDRR